MTPLAAAAFDAWRHAGDLGLEARWARVADAVRQALTTERHRRVAETHHDALRLVEDILDEHLVDIGEGRELDAATGPAILDALLGDPVATRHDDGTISLAWASDEHQACIVARPLLEQLVANLNAAQVPGPRA